MAEILDGGKMAENFTPFGGIFFAYLFDLIINNSI